MLYDNASRELFIGRDEYEATLAGWKVSPILAGDMHIGAVMFRDHEIHVAVSQEYALRYGRTIIRRCLDENIRKHGYLTTVSFKDQKTIRFLERLGFRKTNEDDTLIWYRIDQPKLKERICHQ